MHQKAFSARTLSLTCLTSAGILGHIKGAYVGEGAEGKQCKNLVIWNFGYGFNILKD
jgi:hypothetical protein